MRKKLSVIAAVLFSIGMARGQEYKLAKSSGRLEIKEVNHLTLEGYGGNEIIFSAENGSRKNDERAKGLRAVSNSGLEDNSGIGLSVIDKNGVIEVQQLKKMDSDRYIIKVPKGVIISYLHSSPYGDNVVFKNIESEIEVSTVHNSISLANVTGPMTIKSVHGNIDVALSPTIKSPVSIVSVHGHVDVALAVATKANLKLGTVYGEIFIDPDFKIEIEKTDGMVKYSDNVTGKINGGGLDITLSSTHNNVYLRKK